MSHNTLIEKITADVAAEVADIKAAGQAEVEAIQRETEQQLSVRREAEQAGLDKKLAQLELVAVSKAKQAGKIALQTAKRAEIDALFAKVEAELAGQAAEGYVRLFTKYANEMIPAGAQVVSVRAPEHRVEETKNILKAQGLTGEVVSDSRIKAGFVLHAADGVYDITLARIMSEARAVLEMEVVQTVLA